MTYFFERTETANTISIVLRPHSLYLMLGMLAFWLFNDLVLKSASAANIVIPVFLVFMVVRFFSLIRVQKEVIIAMKQGRVTTQGSKFSFANPFTYIIKK
ncbi:hypothetical protein ABT56_21890 [Photobacterium aquae]|uniref:Uncharacterized protein n=1 Tax=Photobacterium aquae TaxID=1195763 RepID=A0A0J1GPA9_9GAMM|nr:hypothetical protein [Photobacterium aquae]KLV01608.1 hypothetical protein ABT56_21890 [Photobacterium aquae]